jgi:nitrogen fixation protein FixH
LSFIDHNYSSWRNPWVLSCIAAVVIVLMANGVMIYFSVSTSPGLSEKNYYEAGQNYLNNQQKILQQKKQLGWNVDFTVTKISSLKSQMTLTVNKQGDQLVDIDSVELFFYRPSNQIHDFSMPMKPHSTGFLANVTFPLKGVWDVMALISKKDIKYQVKKRVELY